MNIVQFLNHVIRPTLKDIDMWSEEAERLLLGTALHESGGLQYIKQIRGPALGFYQMEPSTYEDLYYHLGDRKHQILQDSQRSNISPPIANPDSLLYDMKHMTVACRLQYSRFPRPIPSSIEGQADYWKKYWNTSAGKGTVEQYIEAWNTHTIGLRI